MLPTVVLQAPQSLLAPNSVKKEGSKFAVSTRRIAICGLLNMTTAGHWPKVLPAALMRVRAEDENALEKVLSIMGKKK